MTIEFRSLGSVTTVKLDHPYKAATVEEDTMLLPHSDRYGWSSFPLSGTEGVLLNADTVTISEVAARYKGPDARLGETSALQRSDGASERKRRLEPPSTGEDSSPDTRTRESAWSPGMLSCEKVRTHSTGSHPDRFDSSGKSGRAISQTWGIGMPTIRKYCGIIHDKFGTHSRLAIGLWAIREGARFNLNPVAVYGTPSCHEMQTAPEERLWR